MSQITRKLWLLNLWRWIRFQWAPWLILFTIYSVTCVWLLQTVVVTDWVEKIGFFSLWGIFVGYFVVAAAISAIGIALPAFRMPRLRLYLLQEIRLLRFWVPVFLGWAAAYRHAFVHPIPEWAFILIVLSGTMVGLMRLYRWIPYERRNSKDGLALSLLDQFVGSRVLQFTLFGIFFGPWFWMGLAAVLGASIVAFEGDSSRPGIVHWMSVALGFLFGVIVKLNPWLLLIILYTAASLRGAAAKRLKSAIAFEEDEVIP
jgi:hypothetical protein